LGCGSCAWQANTWDYYRKRARYDNGDDLSDPSDMFGGARGGGAEAHIDPSIFFNMMNGGAFGGAGGFGAGSGFRPSAGFPGGGGGGFTFDTGGGGGGSGRQRGQPFPGGASFPFAN